MIYMSANGQVQFKQSHRHFLRSATVDRHIEIGDFVMVEADRGEDLGVSNLCN